VGDGAPRPGFEVVAPEVVPDLAQYLKAQSLTDGESMRL
jgi:hypothetical protein